jgi:hypothetical protein
MIPQKVVQTFRKINMQEKTVKDALRKYYKLYVPTSVIEWHFENEAPQYIEHAKIVRTDDFTRRTPETTNAEISLTTGFYVAEWEATLWENVKLENTWTWYNQYKGDNHSKHARAQAWGIILFGVPNIGASSSESQVKTWRGCRTAFQLATTEVEYNQDHSTVPLLWRNNDPAYPYDFPSEEDELILKTLILRCKGCEGVDDYRKSLDDTILSLQGLQQRDGGQMPDPPDQFHYFELSLHPKTLQVGALQKSCGQESEFPLELIYNCTLHDIVEKIKEASGKLGTNGWILTLPDFACLPLVATPPDQLQQHYLSTNITLLAMADGAKNLLTNEVLTVGAALRIKVSGA